MTAMTEHMNKFREQENQHLVIKLQGQLSEIQEKMTMIREELCESQQRESTLSRTIAAFKATIHVTGSFIDMKFNSQIRSLGEGPGEVFSVEHSMAVLSL